jgi:hypothetical protein
MNYSAMKIGFDWLKLEHEKCRINLIQIFLQKCNKGLWLVTKLVEQLTIDFKHMIQTVDCTVFRNCDHWSKSDRMNGSNEPFILSRVWISSDPRSIM